MIQDIGYVIDNTTKTRAIFEINKGSTNWKDRCKQLYSRSERRIPFQNMIYIADGPSDVPVFSLINQNGAGPMASMPGVPGGIRAGE